MKQTRRFGVLALAIALAGAGMTSCTDCDYDLSNMDSTVAFDVDNLVVPINLDTIKMHTIVDLDESSKIKKIWDGTDSVYALVQDGDFESDPIDVMSFTAAAPVITPIKDQLDLVIAGVPAKEIKTAGGTQLAYYPLSQKTTAVNTKATDVDKSIKSVDYLAVDDKTAMTVEVVITDAQKKLAAALNTIRFEELVLVLPHGINVSEVIYDGVSQDGSLWSYDKENGELDLSKMDIETGSDESFSLTVKVAGFWNNDQIDFNADNRVFKLTADCKVKSGAVTIYQEDFKEGKTVLDLPGTVNYTCTPEMSNIKVTHFTGEIEYSIKDLDIEDVTLDDIPDFLNQDGTKIKISNPQIYLSMNNPMYEGGYELKAQSGFRLTPTWNKDGKRDSRTIDMDEPLVVENDVAQQVFCMSPSKPDHWYKGYDDAKWHLFSKLGDVVYHETLGLPTTIGVTPVDPQVPRQKVESFELGKRLNAVNGKYTFFAPFELTEGSVIQYVKEEKDWDEESLEKLTVKKLKVNFDVEKDLPYDVEFDVVPYIKATKTTPAHYDENVKGHTKVLMADTSAEVELKTVDGSELAVTNLDGVKMVATIYAHEGKALSPDMMIVVKNLKITVSGRYVEVDD